MVTVVCAPTLLWLTLNVTVAFPAGTVTEAGVFAAEVSELDSVTIVPPTGATPAKVTVPVTAVVALPFTVLGDTEIEASVGACTVIVAC